MLGEGLSDGVSQHSGVCATIQSSTNYIYAGVCFSMVLAVIVLSVLLSEATTKLAHAHDKDHKPCSVFTTCDSCAGQIGLTGADSTSSAPCMWCAGNQTCGVKTPERQHDCLVNWGSHAVNQLAQCPTRLLFECNATATHGHGGTGGCTACSACCHGDFISDGKECDTCVKDLCPAASNCKHVLPRLCSQAKREDIKACNDCVTLNTKELLGWGCTTGNITDYCEAPDRP